MCRSAEVGHNDACSFIELFPTRALCQTHLPWSRDLSVVSLVLHRASTRLYSLLCFIFVGSRVLEPGFSYDFTIRIMILRKLSQSQLELCDDASSSCHPSNTAQTFAAGAIDDWFA